MQLEKSIEKNVVKYAKSIGFLTFKFESQRIAGLPDRIFLYDGFVFFVEFKSKKGRISDSQIKNIKLIMAQQVPIFIINDAGLGEQVLDFLKKEVSKLNFKYINSEIQCKINDIILYLQQK